MQHPTAPTLKAPQLSRREMLALLGSALVLPAIARAAPLTTAASIPLSDLDLSFMDQDWNIAQKNLSVLKKPLTIAGQTYETGVGTHATSLMNLRLQKGARRFKALVGVDDGGEAVASVRFSILGDGKEVWNSGPRAKGQAALAVDLDISQYDWLTLKVDNGGNGNAGDHADWANAVFEGVTTPPVAVDRLPSEAGLILPGRAWLDTAGNSIQAHGGGLLRHGDRWWWYGEDRSRGYVAIGVSAYSSTNLIDWQPEGLVLPREAYHAKHGDRTLCERPKVIFNPKTGKFVLWFHYDRSGYGDSRAGVAIADKPEGPFTYLGEHRPIETSTFRDMNLFADGEQAYVFYAGEENATMHVVRLNAEWTAPELPMVQGKTWERILVKQMREAPAPFKHAGKYYLITSGCTGWRANPANLAVADTPLGPWKSLGNPCVGPGAATTYESQSTFVLPAPGAPEGHFIYMGDRWKPQSLRDSRHIWLPFQLTGAQTKIEWLSNWKP